jgi:hypothetical protein
MPDTLQGYTVSDHAVLSQELRERVLRTVMQFCIGPHARTGLSAATFPPAFDTALNALIAWERAEAKVEAFVGLECKHFPSVSDVCRVCKARAERDRLARQHREWR